MARPGYIVCLCPDGACAERVQRLMRQAMERDRDARVARGASESTYEELCDHYRQIAEQVQLHWLRHGVCPSSPRQRQRAK